MGAKERLKISNEELLNAVSLVLLPHYSVVPVALLTVYCCAFCMCHYDVVRNPSHGTAMVRRDANVHLAA